MFGSEKKRIKNQYLYMLVALPQPIESREQYYELFTGLHEASSPEGIQHKFQKGETGGIYSTFW
jgi:hypothetical protein